jgi:outer membrane protein assembly factor BamB
LVALKAVDGQPVWAESLTSARSMSAMGTLNNVARPAIADGVVYAVGNSGHIVAVRLKTGERLWSADVSGNQMPWVAGDFVFVVDTGGQLMALDRKSGQILWVTKLKGSSTWSGPVLAGKHLWLVSAAGDITSVDGATGRIVSSAKIGSKAYIAPIVAQGRMFVLSDSAKLIAYN